MTVGELCQLCGLCCQGAFLRYALLDANEAVRLESLGVPTTTRRDGQRALRLGCRALSGTRCAIYQARPAACDSYFCQLAFRLRHGVVAPEIASQVVEQAQALLREIEADLPPRAEDDPPSVMERAHHHGLLSGPALLRRAEALFREHFLVPGQP
ncbi:MAG: YkgJ family cysteine cluster protein [Deltaproteobacteria bacterium]|nr:YkgJ family cysteine cluster protein [Deltaproteobacteria bacterium]